jgi:hypothetical protein
MAPRSADPVAQFANRGLARVLTGFEWDRQSRRYRSISSRRQQVGPHSGKGTGELGLVRSLLKGFCPGDVMLADALYCNYFLIATLMAAGVDVLFEQNGSRITDLSP